jgi:hypothetical protein
MILKSPAFCVAQPLGLLLVPGVIPVGPGQGEVAGGPVRLYASISGS